jgi:hypothetical protein
MAVPRVRPDRPLATLVTVEEILLSDSLVQLITTMVPRLAAAGGR